MIFIFTFSHQLCFWKIWQWLTQLSSHFYPVKGILYKCFPFKAALQKRLLWFSWTWRNNCSRTMTTKAFYCYSISMTLDDEKKFLLSWFSSSFFLFYPVLILLSFFNVHLSAASDPISPCPSLPFLSQLLSSRPPSTHLWIFGQVIDVSSWLEAPSSTDFLQYISAHAQYISALLLFFYLQTN